ncbi:MAG TPA: penicillin-binding transpeptidase domain-containing protein, partial [Candidatus Eisenbacteria bacterium]|nr:penicillin-binding transpeptidase domain-containing protein [Candidatus Eisenbacteria bacterium]
AETRGLVPDDAYYDRHFRAGHWPKGVLLNLGIGQGELLVSPLQLALMAAIVANGGTPLRPHVVAAVAGDRAFHLDKPLEPGVATSPANWQAVHDAMRLVVVDGTAAALRLPGLDVAGKTGTAQNPHGKDHALFVCYAPFEAPTIALAVVAENSGHGGAVSAPVAAAALRRLFLRDTTATAPRPPSPGDSTAVID